VSKGLPSREQAIELLHKSKCPQTVIDHCKVVADLAVEIASKFKNRGFKINLQLVEAGAILHDIGRSKSHSVDHGLIGAKIIESDGLPEELAKTVRRHVGGGITSEEAARFGWPKDVYIPQTLEDKIVSYADKLVDKEKRVPIGLEIKKLSMEHKEAAERVKKLHEEITNLLGNEP
jgi:uncharacterized protein